MLLPISSIRPASDPIRKSWDEDKLNELAQSIAEQGLIVPTKVRPHPDVEACSAHGFVALSADESMDSSDETTDCIECRFMLHAFWGQENLERDWFEYDEGEITPARPFEVVYGHRRLEAMRRNGATEIECVIEGIDDMGALVQALIENVQREDISPIDEAHAYQVILGITGWSSRQVAKKIGKKEMEIFRVLALLKESPEIQQMVGRGHAGTRMVDAPPVSEKHVLEVRRAASGSLDDQTKLAILKKVEQEFLSSEQTRRVAESVAVAPSIQAKEMLLSSQYSPVLHDPEHIKARAQTYGAHDPLYRTDNGKTQQKTWDNAPEVKMIIDGVINAAKSWTMLIAEIRRMVEVGKMAPEGRQFTASKLRSLAQTLSSFADELEQEKELEHA